MSIRGEDMQITRIVRTNIVCVGFGVGSLNPFLWRIGNI